MSPNVLITAGSRRVALVQAFQRALRLTGGGSVVVTDINPLSPAVHVADLAFAVPLSTDPVYPDAIADICDRQDVGLVVPTIDDELPVFADQAARFARAGVRVAVSPPETTRLCNDKFATSQALAARGIDAARTWLPADLPAEPPLPLFVKPRTGRGGVAAFAARNARELAFFLDYVPDPVVQTFLHGPEFTIDVLCGFDGEPLMVVPRERVVVRSGVVDRGRTVRDRALIDLGVACARALPFAGAINIQCRVVDGRPVVFEINPRFSGGIPLTIAAGADFPLALLQLARGRHVPAAVGRFRDQLWMTSYETSVFLSEGAIGFADPRARARIPEVA